MTEKIICPECGFENSPETEWCDSCGVPLPQPEVEGQESLWYEAGTKVRVDIQSNVFEEFDAVREFVGHHPVMVSLHIDQSDEASSVRRISRATCQVDDEQDVPASLKTWLAQQQWVVEELGPMLGAQHPEHPDSISSMLRLPLVETMHGKHRVRVFVDRDNVSLEELVVQARGHLTLQQVVTVFRALLNSIRHLHDERLLYLRLSPWTIHVPRAILEHPRVTALHEDTLAMDPFETAEALAVGSEDETIDVDTQSIAQLRGIIDSATATLKESTDEDVDDNSESTVERQTIQDPLRDTDEMDAVDPLALSGDEAFAEDSESFDDEDVVVQTLSEGFTLDDTIGPFGAEPHITALLDGSFRLLKQGQTHDEIPVVLGFSAPELFSRTRSDVDVQCDVFSLGMVLYFLIAGELPPTSIYTRHTPALPARNFRPDFPIGFQSIIKRATRPDPAERFADLESMIDAFEYTYELMQKREESVHAKHPPMIKLCVETHIGIAKRLRNPVNQDQVFGEVSEDGRFSLIVVADGVSTASFGSGDLASKYLKDAAVSFWDDCLPTYLMDGQVDPYQIIHGILNTANQEIIDYVNEHHYPFEGSAHEVMGSTALVCVILDGVATLGALGDSRAYLQRGRAFEQLTRDHNLWTLSVLDGVLADNALALPHGDALARCLGTFYVDQNRLTAVHTEPDVFTFPVISGDTLLLTTDGLLDFAGPNSLMAEDNILSILLAEPNPDLACLELILLANRGGGGDNIGLSIAKFL